MIVFILCLDISIFVVIWWSYIILCSCDYSLFVYPWVNIATRTCNYPFPIYSSCWFVIQAVFILNKLQSAELEQHFGKFHNLDFENQLLSRFAWNAIVIRPVPQKFICLVKKRNGTF